MCTTGRMYGSHVEEIKYKIEFATTYLNEVIKIAKLYVQ